MRFTTYLKNGTPTLAVVDGDNAVDLGLDLRAALTAGTDLQAAGRAALASATPRLKLADLTLAPLVPEPGKTICLGLNYFDHAKEGGRTEKPDYPWFFYRGKSSLMGHGAPGVVPRVSSKFDYEAEMAVVIGKTVPRHTRRADALQYVFGYTCFNDMSVRDFQKRTPQWTIGKNFDSTGGFGPVLVTDAFDDLDDAVALANDSVFGLAAAIYSNDLSRVHGLIPRLHAGSIYVNAHSTIDPCMPFGGFKDSGFGKDLGPEQLDHLMETKAVWINLD